MTENAEHSCLWKEPGTHWGLLGVTSLDLSGRCLPLWSRSSWEAAAQYPLSPLVGKGKISRGQVPWLAAVVSLCLVPVFSLMMGDAPMEELTAVGVYNQSVGELEIFLNYYF